MHEPLHVTGPLADCMSGSLFQIIYLTQWVKHTLFLPFYFHTEPAYISIQLVYLSPAVCVWMMVCLHDITPRLRVVVECWISLQGITHMPPGNRLPPTKYQERGGGDYCSRAGLEELCVTRQRIFVCECVWGQIVHFSTVKCTVSFSRAHHLPLLHARVSGIHLPVALQQITPLISPQRFLRVQKS